MEKLKQWWYWLVAGQLFEDLRVQRDNYQILLKTNNKLELTRYKLNREIEHLKNTDPIARSIDSVRHNAAQARIRDLEDKLRHNGIEPQ